VGEGGEQQPDLVGRKSGTGEPFSEQIELMFLSCEVGSNVEWSGLGPLWAAVLGAPTPHY
jgi:hypothetical protein